MSLVLRAIDMDDASPIKPWQRLACLLYSNGTPLHDVAKEVNVDYDMISLFVTSPRGVAIMKALVTENPDRMANIVESTVIDSLLTMVKIRDGGKTDQAKLTAASQLLDRFYPKSKASEPPKKGGNVNDFTDIQAEIIRLRGEVMEHSGNPTVGAPVPVG